MKPLDLTFRQDGFTFRQITRGGDVCIYEKYKGTDQEKRCLNYEVFIVRKQEAKTMTLGGVKIQIEAKEHVPSSEEWGKQGWTYQTLYEAALKMQELTSLETVEAHQ